MTLSTLPQVQLFFLRSMDGNVLDDPAVSMPPHDREAFTDVEHPMRLRGGGSAANSVSTQLTRMLSTDQHLDEVHARCSHGQLQEQSGTKICLALADMLDSSRRFSGQVTFDGQEVDCTLTRHLLLSQHILHLFLHSY